MSDQEHVVETEGGLHRVYLKDGLVWLNSYQLQQLHAIAMEESASLTDAWTIWKSDPGRRYVCAACGGAHNSIKCALVAATKSARDLSEA